MRGRPHGCRETRRKKERTARSWPQVATCSRKHRRFRIREKKKVYLVACGGNRGVYAGAPGCSPPFLYSVRNCVLPGLGLYVLSWGQGGECWFAGQTSSRPAGTFNFSVEGTREQIKFKLLPARLLDVSRNAPHYGVRYNSAVQCNARCRAIA